MYSTSDLDGNILAGLSSVRDERERVCIVDKDNIVNIYVGNLSYEVTDSDLQRAFAAFGSVTSAKVINDMQSGRSKGFGFVEMGTKDEGESAIAALNGTELKGRRLTVNEARPREPRSGGGGFSGPRGGGRGGYNNGGGSNRGGDRW